MPEIFIDGQSVQAERTRTCLTPHSRRASNFHISAGTPSFRSPATAACAVQVEDAAGSRSPATCRRPKGRACQTDTERVNEYRKSVLQLLTLNHPVDCGICDKAGECKLQDFHYQYNGSPSISVDPKVRATKFFPLSERIVLDNERCILCSRCALYA